MQSHDGARSDTSMCSWKAGPQLTGRPCGQRCSSSASAVVAVAGREASWWRRPLGSMLPLPLLRAASKRACAAWRRPWGGVSAAGLAGRLMSRLVAVTRPAPKC